jgi:anti-anti-sigma regulatory factor
VLRTDMDDEVMADLKADVLEQAARSGVDTVVLEVSNVRIMDTHLIRSLTRLAQAADLLVARTVVAGLTPTVAIALTELGLDLPGVRMARSLEEALASPEGLR